MKKYTIKFYLNNNQYMGIRYTNKMANIYFEIKSWCESGNYVKINNKKIKTYTV